MIDGALLSVNQGLTTSHKNRKNVAGKGLGLIKPTFNIPLTGLSTPVKPVHPAVLQLCPDVVSIVTLRPPMAGSTLLSAPGDHAHFSLSQTL
jgi:hypothetical protein